MTIKGDYEPSALGWVRDQVAEYEASGGARANTLRDTGMPIVIVTMHGHTSGKVRPCIVTMTIVLPVSSTTASTR